MEWLNGFHSTVVALAFFVLVLVVLRLIEILGKSSFRIRYESQNRGVSPGEPESLTSSEFQDLLEASDAVVAGEPGVHVSGTPSLFS